LTKIKLFEAIEEFPFVLAPLAGYSDHPFRILCKEFGATLVFTEMINVHSITNAKARKRLKNILYYSPEERPIGIQLFGNKPDMFYEAASVAKDMGYDLIDINFGCPVRKVVHSKNGAYLMTDPALACNIIKRTVEAAGDIPVSIKIRSGWDENSINFLEFNKMAEENGVTIITLHARTKAQAFSGRAAWSNITELKKISKLFVIGNGDITDRDSANKIMEITSCDAGMIGRGAIGNPFIFKSIKDEKYSPSHADKINVALRHFDLMSEFKGKRAVFEIRKFIAKYIKDFDDAAKIRKELFAIEDVDRIKEYLKSLKDQINLI